MGFSLVYLVMPAFYTELYFFTPVFKHRRRLSHFLFVSNTQWTCYVSWSLVTKQTQFHQRSTPPTHFTQPL